MGCVKYNNIIDVQYVPVDAAEYPASIDDLKKELNMQFDTEGSYEFNDDDTLLQEDIAAATAAIEKYTGRLLRAHDVTAIIRNELGGQALPYGPVTAFATLVNEDGDAIDADNYSVQGLDFKTLKSPCYAYMTATYSAGYTPATIPADLKKAVLHEAVFLYTNRGDQTKQYAAGELDISPSAKRLAQPYRRVVWLL